MALPSEKVLKRWRDQFSWLDITNNKTLIHVEYAARKKTNSVGCQTLVWVSYLEALTVDCLLWKIMTILLATNVCHSWKIAWRSRCSWKIFTAKKNSASSTYFRITHIFRYLTDEWKRSWNSIKTLQYFISRCKGYRLLFTAFFLSCSLE